MLMAGADVTMLCSTLIRHGIPQIGVIERELVAWMEEHEYESVSQLKGSLSQKNCPEPERLRARAIHAGHFQLRRAVIKSDPSGRQTRWQKPGLI